MVHFTETMTDEFVFLTVDVTISNRPYGGSRLEDSLRLSLQFSLGNEFLSLQEKRNVSHMQRLNRVSCLSSPSYAVLVYETVFLMLLK